MSYKLKDQNVSHNGQVYNIQALVDYIERKNIPVRDIPLEDLFSQLQEDCWGDGENINYSPIDVLTNRFKNNEYIEHYKRSIDSDLNFPIIYNKKYECISDGMHRLLKAYVLGHITIKTYILETLPAECCVNNCS